jgi:hypothetical protein
MTSESISSARVRHRLLYWAAVAVALLSCTLLTYSEIGRFLFSGTLLLKTVRLSFPSMIAVTLLLLVAPLSLLRRTRGSPFHVTVAASVALWLVCGRAVGLSWDGEFRSGWFFCATQSYSLVQARDPDDFLAAWSCQRAPLWTIELHRSHHQPRRIVVGPFLMSSTVDLLNQYGCTIR